MSGIGGKKKNHPQPFQNVKVVVRVRPLNKQENDQHVKNVIKIHTHRELFLKEKKYSFDRIFKPTSSQIEVYLNVVAPLIQDVVAGYNCTVFAYGQTGSGKTFTMTGNKCNISSNWKDDDEAGIIPRAAFHVFEEINKLPKVETMVKVSYIELYNEEIRDLLSDDEGTLNLYSDTKGALFIQGLQEIPVYDSEDICKLLQKGIVKKQIAPTLMNHQSSRSHTVFTISVTISESTIGGDDILKAGKINLVDLAGSENIARSGCKDLRAMELANINRSLLTLGRVIHALADKMQKHIPYRDSKLTRILQDSLGGHTKTVIITTVSPDHTSQEETASALDYATRARDIKNTPVVNEKMTKHEIIDGLVKEIDRLQRDLDAARTGTGFYVHKENYQRLLDAIMAVTGAEITAEELECKKAERIHDLEEIMKIRMQQFENTVKQCKKHQEELELARETVKQKDHILEQEKFLSQWYENQTNERMAEIQVLFSATNDLHNEKEILLAKLENVFSINANNESITKTAVQEALSAVDTIHIKVNQLECQKNAEIQFKDKCLNQKDNLKIHLQHLEDAKVNLLKSDVLGNSSVRTTLETHIGNHQDIFHEKCVSLEKMLFNCDEQLKTFQLKIPDVAFKCKEKIQKSVQNLNSFFANEALSENIDRCEVIKELEKAESQLLARRKEDEKMLKELEFTSGIIRNRMEFDISMLNTLQSVKAAQSPKGDLRIRKMESIISEFKNEVFESLQKFEEESSNNLDIQETSGEVRDIIDSFKQFTDKLDSFTETFEHVCKNASEDFKNSVIKTTIEISTDFANDFFSTLNDCINMFDTRIRSTETFSNAFRDFVINLNGILTEDILKKNVKVKHIGDTPVKKPLELPSRIELMPKEVLLDRFAKAYSKVDEVENFEDSD